MSTLGVVLVVVLILVLLGGVGPHYYTGAPWQPGYGLGWGGNGLLAVVLIIVIILLLTGRLG
jgi:hypothetical protein